LKEFCEKYDIENSDEKITGFFEFKWT
jgi:hypothetical protein